MWLTPPENLTLSEDEAHIWRADLVVDESTENSFFALLAADEKSRAAKFRFASDRRNYVAARGILRLLISNYLEIEPAAIFFQYSRFGKPEIANNTFLSDNSSLQKRSLQFNISHSKNTALFAFTRKLTIGVDIEFVNPAIEVKDIAKNFFSANEIVNLLALPVDQQVAGFFNCWTRKEAFIKAVGEGLSFPLDQFEVSLEPGQPAKLFATHWDPKAVSKWSMYSIDPESNFVGCLVLEGFVEQVKLWDWRTDGMYSDD